MTDSELLQVVGIAKEASGDLHWLNDDILAHFLAHSLANLAGYDVLPS